MEAIKITELCKRSQQDRYTVDKMVDKLGIQRFKVPINAWAVTPSDAQVVLKELGLPQELQGNVFWAKYLHPAANKRYGFCKVHGIPNKHPVLIPPRFAKKMHPGKRLQVERIEDESGVTFRHAWYRKLKSYDG